MGWHIYPQFKDAIRIADRLTTVEDYITDACGERVGPAAATCLVEARTEAQRLLRSEQGKSLLLIDVPVIIYFLVVLPLQQVRRLQRR